MRIICRECQNEKYFTQRREVHVDFDYRKGEWDELSSRRGEKIIICKECGADTIIGDIDVKD